MHDSTKPWNLCSAMRCFQDLIISMKSSDVIIQINLSQLHETITILTTFICIPIAHLYMFSDKRLWQDNVSDIWCIISVSSTFWWNQIFDQACEGIIFLWGFLKGNSNCLGFDERAKHSNKKKKSLYCYNLVLLSCLQI